MRPSRRGVIEALDIAHVRSHGVPKYPKTVQKHKKSLKIRLSHPSLLSAYAGISGMHVCALLFRPAQRPGKSLAVHDV